MGHSQRRTRIRDLGVLACCAALSVSAAACSSSASSSGSSGSGLEKTHLTVGALAVADDAPLYLAIKDGYFRQEGLTVTPVAVAASTEAIPDMLRGSVDIIAGANYVSFFEAQSKGVVSFKVLADATHCQADSFDVMALPGSGITGPAGLAGKTVAVNLTGNVQTLTLDSVLTANGLKAASVHYVEVPFPDMVAALKAHRVDAISAIEPYITASEEQDGAASVMSQCTGPTSGFPLSGYFATSAWAAKYPNTAKAFQKAIDKAQALADSDPQAVRAILPTYTAITAKTADVLNLNSYPTSVSLAPLKQVETLMQSQGMLSNPLNVTSVMLP